MVIRTLKVMLKPNNKQITRFIECANISRFVYNWTLSEQQKEYKNSGKFIYDNELRRKLTQLKKTEKFKWLNSISNNIPKQSIKDACNAYKNLFNGVSNYPKFKTKRKSVPSFYQDCGKISFTATHVKLEKIARSKKKNKQNLNWVRLAEVRRIPFEEGVKYSNPRVTFDGLNWWISVGIEYDIFTKNEMNEGIGIDLGVSTLAYCSDGQIYKSINKSNTIKKLEKKKRRLQRKISRKYQYNKEGEVYQKTCNIIKSEKQLLKISRRMTNIRKNYLHQTTSKIVKRKPKFIVLEDLDVTSMLNNKYLSRAIQEQSFYEFRRQIEYKCERENIIFILADRWFPSSKTCSDCGYVKNDLKLSDRIYKCENCNLSIDRDYQASLNLKQYGERIIQST